MENHLEKLIVKSVLLDMFTQHLIENMLLSCWDTILLQIQNVQV